MGSEQKCEKLMVCGEAEQARKKSQENLHFSKFNLSLQFSRI